jgi:large subunit ribosomal protein L5
MAITDIYLEKVTINIGIGQNENLLENAKALITKLTGHNPTATYSKKRDPTLKLRKGQVIGTMATIRGEEAGEFLKKALDANGNVIGKNSIANNSLNFGVKEYIYFSGVKYDPKIGILGMNVNSTFTRKGKRVETRRRSRSSMGKKHAVISREEILEYLKKYGIKMEE